MKFIKVIFISAVLMLSSLSSLAQDRDLWYMSGYRWNIEIDAGSTLSRTFAVSASTSHGYRTGNGMYFGAGAGITFNPNDYAYVTVPIFADWKYSFMNKDCSPYLAVKVGTELNLEDLTAGLMFKPSVGVDVGKFSMHFGYGFCNGKTSITAIGYKEYKFTKHTFTVGASYWF